MKKFNSVLKTRTRKVKRRAPHLHAWKGVDHSVHPLLGLSPFAPLDGTHTKRVLADLHSSPDLSDLQSFSVPLSAAWGGGKTRVYARSEQEAENTLRQFEALP